MKCRMWLAGALVALLWATPARADNSFIVRSRLSLQALQTACTPLLLPPICKVVRGLGDPQLFLITSPLDLNGLLNLVGNPLGILDAEIDQLLSLIGGLNLLPAPIPATLMSDRSSVPYGGTNVWNSYANQTAAGIVEVQNALKSFNVTGTGIVADIDTGVDPTHPVLQPVLVPGDGYDFTRNQPGGSELNDISSSPCPFTSCPPPPCPNCSPAKVNQSTAAVLDQSTAAVLDGDGSPAQCAAFGHGTMVMGIIHLVAPTAMLMPLKAFHSDGTASLSDILRAIYYAVQNGANVINMSFDLKASSAELKKALDYANQHGVICAASAGNDGMAEIVYPAAWQTDVMGVASTTDQDARSSFSNFGINIVWVAAPGEGIVTTYPFNTYAAGWGTSFSAPFVSGTSALLHNKESANEAQAAAAIAHAQTLPDSTLGHGRLDIAQALQSVSPADFSISTNPTTATITAGQAATYTVTLTPINAFSQTVALTCGGEPAASSCTIVPPALTLNGANPLTATVTVQTTARAAAPAGFIGIGPSSGTSARFGWIAAWIAGLLVWATLSHLGIATHPGRGLAAALGLVTFSLALYSCGSSSSSSSSSSPGTPGGPPPASLTLSSIALSPTTVSAGVPSSGLVTLSGTAPSGGAVVTLSSSNTSAATVPASVTVPAGVISARFAVATSSVTTQTSVTITASYGSGSQQSAVLTVTPATSAPSLTSLTVNPTSVNGGNSSTGTVTLSSAAEAGGVMVSLSSSDTSVATVPPNVTVAAGATSASFTVKTTPVNAATTRTSNVSI